MNFSKYLRFAVVGACALAAVARDKAMIAASGERRDMKASGAGSGEGRILTWRRVMVC